MATWTGTTENASTFGGITESDAVITYDESTVSYNESTQNYDGNSISWTFVTEN